MLQLICMVTIRQTEKADTHQSFTPKQNHKLAASMNHCGIAIILKHTGTPNKIGTSKPKPGSGHDSNK